MTVQRDEAWLKQASPEQIVKAQQAGELDDLTGRSRYPSTGQLTAEHLGRMDTREIRQAYKAGRLADVLGTDDDAA
jgi:hypothetical protein